MSESSGGCVGSKASVEVAAPPRRPPTWSCSLSPMCSWEETHQGSRKQSPVGGLPSNPGSAMLHPEPVSPPQTSASSLCNGTVVQGAKRGCRESWGQPSWDPLVSSERCVCLFPLINNRSGYLKASGPDSCWAPGPAKSQVSRNLYKLLCTLYVPDTAGVAISWK